MPPITPDQIADLHAKAATYPALNEALLCLHECVNAQYRSDVMGAADMAAKAAYDLIDQCWLFDDTLEAAE